MTSQCPCSLLLERYPFRDSILRPIFVSSSCRPNHFALLSSPPDGSLPRILVRDYQHLGHTIEEGGGLCLVH